MVDYAYAVVHDGARCLVFTKNMEARFFKGNVRKVPIAHGPGSNNFPGGGIDLAADSAVPTDPGYPADHLLEFQKTKIKNDITYRKAALREFREETGVDLDVKAGGYQATVKASASCAHVFFRVSPEILDKVYGKAAKHIARANSDDWATNDCKITDNEQASVSRVDVTALPGAYFTSGSPTTGWFYLVVNGLNWATV